MKHLTLVLLAAGASRRFGNSDKLLAQWNGRPLLAHTLDKYRTAQADRRLIVIRPDAPELAALCREHGFEPMENPLADKGIGGSIALAARRCAGGDGVMIALGDMPRIKEATIDALIATWRKATDTAIVAPIFRGHRGHPVILSARYLPELSALAGDRGAAGVIREHKSSLIGMDVEDAGVAIDFDERADFMEPDQDTREYRRGPDGDHH